MSSIRLKPSPASISRQPSREAPVGPRTLEKRAEAADESIVEAARTNKQADMNTQGVVKPASKTAGPTFGEEVPWLPPPYPVAPPAGVQVSSGKPYKLK